MINEKQWGNVQEVLSGDDLFSVKKTIILIYIIEKDTDALADL